MAMQQHHPQDTKDLSVEKLRDQVAALALALVGLSAEVDELRDGPRTPRLYSYGEAAAELRVTESWLRSHARRFPRVKSGGGVFFTADDLAQIVGLLRIEPERSPVVHVRSRSLSDLKPLPARRPRGPQ